MRTCTECEGSIWSWSQITLSSRNFFMVSTFRIWMPLLFFSFFFQCSWSQIAGSLNSSLMDFDFDLIIVFVYKRYNAEEKKLHVCFAICGVLLARILLHINGIMHKKRFWRRKWKWYFVLVRGGGIIILNTWSLQYFYSNRIGWDLALHVLLLFLSGTNVIVVILLLYMNIGCKIAYF